MKMRGEGGGGGGGGGGGWGLFIKLFVSLKVSPKAEELKGKRFAIIANCMPCITYILQK